MWKIILFESLSSTNDKAREFGLKGEDRLVIVADYQERGRGRRGRSWFSRPRENLLFSLLIKKN